MHRITRKVESHSVLDETNEMLMSGLQAKQTENSQRIVAAIVCFVLLSAQPLLMQKIEGHSALIFVLRVLFLSIALKLFALQYLREAGQGLKPY